MANFLIQDTSNWDIGFSGQSDVNYTRKMNLISKNDATN
jgi:hypothetical protein